FRTFWLMGFLRVLDVYRDVPLTFRMVPTIFSGRGWSEMFSGGLLKFGLSTADFIVVFAACVVMLVVGILQGRGTVCGQLSEKPRAVRWTVIWVLIVIIITLGAYGIGYDAAQFIYNQF
ncbi:MAG: MBOAT family protein, partial [Firmicutes bacterium]|nr:MBOAT family protein [Bacillota bacterium]